MQALEIPPYYSNYIEKDDIAQIIETHKSSFDWSGKQHILDVDCGLGEVTEKLLYPIIPKESFLMGCDECNKMINYCKQKIYKERLSFETIDVQYMDLTFDYKLESFDKIFSFYCIRWIQNCRRTFANMYSLLKPKGDILLVFLTPDNPMNLAFEDLRNRFLWEKFLNNLNWFYEAYNPLSYVRTTLTEIGFQDVYCYLKTTTTTYPSWDAYLELIKNVNPYMRHFNVTLHPECMLFVKQYLKEDDQVSENRTTGEITVTYKLVVALAKKKTAEKSR